jgi:hypothetical protein
VSKRRFFVKKRAKNFLSWGHGMLQQQADAERASYVAFPEASGAKKFFGSFFKKRTTCFF